MTAGSRGIMAILSEQVTRWPCTVCWLLCSVVALIALAFFGVVS